MLSGPLETTLRTFSSVTSHQKPPPTTHSVSNPFYDSCTATRLHMGFARATCAELSLARSHLAELPSGPSGGEGNQMTRTLSAMTTVNRIFDSQAPNLNLFFAKIVFQGNRSIPTMPCLHCTLVMVLNTTYQLVFRSVAHPALPALLTCDLLLPISTRDHHRSPLRSNSR